MLRRLHWRGTKTPSQEAADDPRVLAALRAGDEDAFAELVRELNPAMVRLARAFVPSDAVAEEVAQEAWLGVLRGLDRFEGRSSLRTWILRITVNRARTRGEREGRSLPFSALAAREAGGDAPTVEPERFIAAGAWASPPRPLPGPEERLLGRETIELVRTAIDALGPAQRTVISLRDLEGWEPREVCELLDISEGNQRVLLHRARAAVRAVLEPHLEV